MFQSGNIRIGMVWHGKTPKGWIEANRKIYDYELVYFASGKCRTITENRTIVCDEGSLLIIPPDYEYVCIADADADRWCIHFDWFGDCPAYANGENIQVIVDKKHTFTPALAAKRIPEEVMKCPTMIKFSPAGSAQMQSLLRAFFTIFPDKIGTKLQRQGIFLQILGRIMESAGHSSHERRERNTTFVCVKRLIDQNFDDPAFELKSIAAELRITPNHLNKLFKTHLGISPNKYLRNIRLDHAVSLLETTRSNIGEIAAECGFATANYFIRSFKAENRITPQKFRENRSRQTEGEP